MQSVVDRIETAVRDSLREYEPSLLPEFEIIYPVVAPLLEHVADTPARVATSGLPFTNGECGGSPLAAILFFTLDLAKWIRAFESGAAARASVEHAESAFARAVGRAPLIRSIRSRLERSEKEPT